MLDIDTEKLKDLYLNKRMPLLRIAQELGCSQHVLYLRLKTLKITRERLTLVEDLTGQKFQHITALEYVKNDKFGKALWKFQCDCGKIKVLNAASAKAGLTSSCGCKRSEGARKGYKDISGAFWHKLARSALSRDYEFSIKIEEAWDKLVAQNNKCAVSGVDICLYTNNDFSNKQTASPDRIDSNIGYTKDNFQWVHKRINRVKGVLSTDELLFWSSKILEHNKTKEIKQFDVTKIAWD